MPTVFEKLLSGEWPCAKVYEDEHVFAFMDAGQVNDGHVIVASKHPYETLMDMDEDTAAAMMRAAWKVARAVETEFKPQGMTVLQCNRPAGWQTVPHVHMHVLPRYEGDGPTLGWPRREPGIERLRELAARLDVR
ncbi:MAG TPA: HIT family protein [Burkholderiaceae bacterium]|nr:HIT family protein [Burkholderiaceae bacterium]